MCATVEYSDGSRQGNVFILRALKAAACECVFLQSAGCQFACECVSVECSMQWSHEVVFLYRVV